MIGQLFNSDKNQNSDSYYQALKAFRLDPEQNLIKVKSRIGMDAATAYAQLFFESRNTYKRLRRELELHRSEYNQLNKEIDVMLIAPPTGFISKNINQAFVKQCTGLAMTAGFNHVSHVQLNTANALEGGRRLLRMIEEKTKRNRNILLVSASYGSAFVRVMLDNLDDDRRKKIQGWLNISGLINGTPRFDCSDRFRLFRAVSKDQRSFSCEQRYLREPFNPRGVKVIHMLGLKLEANMTSAEKKQRDFLKAWGPNDGLVTYHNYQFLSDPVISFLNQGHMLNISSISSTYVRSLSAMVSTIPVLKRPVMGEKNQYFL